MSKNVNIFNSSNRKYLPKKALIQIILLALEKNKSKKFNINVVLVDNKEILRLNKKYLNHNYYTDVITFPLDEKELEGEIYISVDKAEEQAQENNVSLRNELERLAVHGTLHLLGYDDKTEKEKFEMRKLEDKFLKMLN